MEQLQLVIVNEDGTKLNPPENPLKDKWDKMITHHGKPCYPYDKEHRYPLDDGTYGGPIMNYECVDCYESSCQYSNGFVIPKEDEEEYNKHLQSVDKYMRIHNPNTYSNKEII